MLSKSEKYFANALNWILGLRHVALRYIDGAIMVLLL
jgi:hypothetical protein